MDINRPIAQYAAFSPETTLRLESTSGGAFTELAKVVLHRGGIVCGAGWGHNPLRAVHKLTDNEAGLAEMRGAKYLSSDFSVVLNDIEVALKSGRPVLFSGTPCQVAVVRKRFGYYVNLFLIAIICHSVPEQRVWLKYVSELEAKAHCELLNVKFRSKKDGGTWRQGMFVADFSDRKLRIVHRLSSNVFAYAFFSGLSTKEACAHCQFKRGLSGADVIIGDFWGIEDCLQEIDDGQGVNAVLVFTEKGAGLLKASQLKLIPVAYESILNKNPHLERNVEISNPDRDWFLHHYEVLGVEKSIKCLCRKNRIMKIVRKIKRLVRKLN